MKILLKQREEFEKEIKNYLKKNFINVKDCHDKNNILDMSKIYGVSESYCEMLLSNYYWLKKAENGVDSVYASYINNNSGSIDYQSSINSWNNLASGTRKSFNRSLELFIDELLKVKYCDLLDNLKLEEITSDRLEEMFELGIDNSQLKNNCLILIYNEYITFKEKETIFKTIAKELKTLEEQICELDSSFLNAEKKLNEFLKILYFEHLQWIRSINFYNDKLRKKKNLKKIKLDSEQELFIGIEESEKVELDNFSFDIELKKDIELYERIKVEIIQQFGLNNMDLVHQSIIDIYEYNQIIDMKLEQLLNYLEKLITIVENRNKEYLTKETSFYHKAFYEFPKKYDLKEQQLEYAIKKSNPFLVIKYYKDIKKHIDFLYETKERRFKYIKKSFEDISISRNQETNNVKTEIKNKISKIKSIKNIGNTSQEVYEEAIGNKKL